MADQVAMRLASLLIIVSGVFSLPGCAGFAVFRCRNPNEQFATVPRPRFSTDPQMEEVVDHLNRNVDKLHGWQAHGVKIRANNMPLSGTLAVQEGQHLRLVVHSIAGHEVDMGSNEEVFWIWAKRMEPSYVYCPHTQIDAARQTLGIPFEPQWLMQALGVARLETQGLSMQIDSAGRQARLIQPVTTAHGHFLQKVMQVDLAHGVITEHSIYDDRGHKIAQARLDDFRLDKPSGVVLAHRVKLDWPQNQMSMVMNLGNIEVNPRSIPSQIWDMPAPMRGVQIVNLGELGSQRRVVENEDNSRVRDVGSTVDDEAGHIQLRFDDAESDPEIKFDPPETTDSNSAVDPVEYRTATIERPDTKSEKPPAKKDWWDE